MAKRMSSASVLGLMENMDTSDDESSSDETIIGDVENSLSESNFYCKSCPSQPGLHPTTCFEKYHTEVVFK